MTWRMIIILLPAVAALALPARAAESFGLVTGEDYLRAQVQEPVFAYVFAMVEADSLGSWSRADLENFAADWVRPSDFPLEHLASMRREVVPEFEQVTRRGLVSDRVITVELTDARLDMPMPYSILGYHPGTLSFGSPLVIREWRLGDREVHVRAAEDTRRTIVQGFTVFQVVSGWAVLDVDSWLDNLLGKNLDDSATLGFAAGRAEGRILGVGINVGREGRFIYGELDFRRNTVVTHGRPLARAMAGAARPYTTPDSGRRTDAWTSFLAATADD